MIWCYWCYIVITMIIGIIAGFGYYEVTRSELNLNYELKEVVMMLRNTKRNAIFIGVIVGAIWPLVLTVLATILIIVALAPKIFNESIYNVKESNDLNLTNHNIVLDKQVESNVVVDDDTATWIAFNDVDETESNNAETTEPNTKD